MRIAMGIEYDGTAFQGWQRLGDTPSLQAAVESALSYVADAPIHVMCSGRTDSGVHAACQVIHFDPPVERSLRGWVLGANTRLPHDVAVLWAQPMSPDFHARYSARARRYRYRILNRPIRAALGRQHLAWERLPLDAGAMHRAAQHLVGEHDFNAFRTVHCQAAHARRYLTEIRVDRAGDVVSVEVEANAFLHHMVRNIVGSLILVGRGERPEAWIVDVLAGRDRTLAGPTAPSGGLTFLGPKYPRQWALPEMVSLAPDAVLPDWRPGPGRDDDEGE